MISELNDDGHILTDEQYVQAMIRHFLIHGNT
jgi:hypothetical protein